ncbi:EamA family transporter [Paenibacillus sp. J31TS4]|uniref:DMT family transporter n=1 Tax=Paenibacillus sp. J31TS4 TaxID=2807195 RepID=UPI001B155E8F|nr:DMT family transporter [Paenibacillus sp. J31TS4]GIP40658.1 EamA family transporter [Paenibacillus sp. J31TS4]
MLFRREVGYVLALLGGVCWALAGVFGQYLFQVHSLTPEWLVSVRLFCAGTLLMIVCKTRGQQVLRIFKKRRDVRDLIIFAVVGAALCQYSYFAAVAASNAATATFISYSSPFFIILLTSLKTRRMPARYEMVSVMLVIVGLFIVATHGNISSLHISGGSLCWAMLSALTFAVYSIQSQRLMETFDTLLITAWGMLLGGGLLLIVFRPWEIKVTSTLSVYAALGVVILFGTILSYILFLEGIRRIGATKGSLLASIEPVVASVLSVVWLNDRFQMIDLLGFALILSTVVVIAKAAKRGSDMQTLQPKKDTQRNEFVEEV